MNPFEAITAFWSAQGESIAQAQARMQSQMAEGIKALMSGTMPAMAGQSGDLAGASAELAVANESVMAMWSAASAMAGTLATEMQGMLAGSGDADATMQAMLLRITDPVAWIAGADGVSGALDRVSAGPRFADLWEVERRYLRVLKAWMALRQGSGAHQAVVLGAWMEAAQRFRAEIAGHAGAEARAADSKALLALWTDTANQALLEAQRSEAFLQTQTVMVRATTELNLAQQELVEFFGKQYGFPTRTELDDVHRTLTEVRREVRQLRREVRTAPEPGAALPATRSPRRARAQPRATQ